MGENAIIRLPGAVIDMSPLTDQNQLDIMNFALVNNVDIISATCVRNADHVN